MYQDRYKSEAVDDDSYFLAVFRYIHHNPQKAGLPPFIWTSYKNYADHTGITDTAFALSLFSSREELLKYLNNTDSENCMEIDEEHSMTGTKAAELICKIGKLNHTQELQNITRETRNSILYKLKSAGLSIRQIERLTGINRGVISRV